jgi:NTE family protein
VKTLAASLILAAALLPAARAEEPAPRPRVGLVLGGGSAKGIAHVGVLKWLEEHRVPVDLVAGTSMGGLIGGSYATGLTAAQIEEKLTSVDWDLMFKSDAPYRLKGYRRKEDAIAYPVKLEMGLRRGLGLPSGMNPGHHIGLLLSEIALPYSQVTDFDELPIPFRCVATDMQKAESVVLGGGSLGTALRATMAIPAVFDPVHDGDRLLSDGGILNNVPVDVARAMGADVVIAVKVGSPTFDPVSESLLGLADRAITLMMEELAETRLAQADLVILPDLRGVTGSDYRSVAAIAQIGYDAAASHAEALLKLSLDEAAWQEHLAARGSRARAVPARSAFIAVAGLPDPQADPLRRRLERSVGDSLDPAPLGLALDRVVGTGRYAAAAFALREKDGRTGLEVTVREKRYAPPFLNFALDINNEEEDVNFNLATRMTAMDLTGFGSELRIDASVGVALGIGGELLQPLGRRGAFVAPRGFVGRAYDNVYTGDDLVASYRRERSGGGADLGWIFPVGQLRLGYESAYLAAERRIGDPATHPDASGHEQVARAAFVTDTRDDPFFPRGGVRLDTTLRWFLKAPDAEDDFGQLLGSVVVALPGPGQDRAFVSGEVGAGLGPEGPALYDLTLGGPFRLSAYDIDQFRGRHTALGRAGYLRSLARLPAPLAERLYLAGVIELGSAFDEISDADLQFSASAGFAVDTFFGPAFLGLAAGDDGAFRLYFTVGRLFR